MSNAGAVGDPPATTTRSGETTRLLFAAAERPLRRVLVTDGDERSALAIVRSLGRAGRYHVYVASRHGNSLAGASRFARDDTALADPLLDPAAFARELSALSRRVNADVLVPVGEASLLAALAHPDLFEHLVVPFPEDRVFRRVCDKAAVLDAAKQVGLTAPAQHVVKTNAEVLDLLQAGALRWPLVVKPTRSVVAAARGHAKVGSSYAASEAELMQRVAAYGPLAFPLLLQERIVGPGIGVFLLRWDGDTLAAFSHRRLREKPPAGGVSVYAESVALDPALLAQCETLLDRFAWRGVAMIEFKIDQETNTAYLMEINGRFWGSLQLAITAGVDFPSLLVAAATNERPAPVGHYRIGIRNRWWWGEVDHLLARMRRSNAELALPPGSHSRARALVEFLRWRMVDHNEVLQRDDVRPFMRETTRWLQRR